MTKQSFYYSKYKWHIIVYYNVDKSDVKDISNTLHNMNVSDKIIYDAIYIITMLNKGFTCTNRKLKTSFICISKTTSADEFMNSIIHESKHLIEDICATYNISLKGEESAYMIGELVMIMFKKFKHYICYECY